MPLNCIFWCISFGRQFVTQPVIWKEIKWWIEIGGGVCSWLLPFFIFIIIFLMNAGEYIAGGPTSLITGAAFPSQLCVFMAEPLLLKYNHSNLCLWFPIERISSLSFPERNLWLFAARIWYFPSVAFSLVPADYWYWLLYLVCSRDFSGLKLLLSNKLISEDLRPILYYGEIWRWHFICSCKLQIFHNGFKCQKCEIGPCPPPRLIWAGVWHENRVIWLLESKYILVC